MAGIDFIGSSSGLPLNDLLKNLKQAEMQRLTPYTNDKAKNQAKISSWGKIASGLNALSGSAKKLGEEAFNALTISATKAFTATTATGALAGSHTITVNQLAGNHAIATEGQPDADEKLGEQQGGERTVTIKQANGKEIKVALKDDETSLTSIAKQINKQGGDVTASVVKSDEGYQLIVTSKTSGSDGKMSITVEGDDALAGVIGTDKGNTTEIAEARDAKLEVNGIEYTRSSNTVNDIITGVTLSLNQVSEEGEDKSGPKKAEILTLSPDNSAVKKSLQEFVKNYNALLKEAASASKYVKPEKGSAADGEVTQQNKGNGALVGDSTLRGLVTGLRNGVNDTYGDGEIAALADLGIKIDIATGQMTLDEKKLDGAIEKNGDDLKQLFVGSEDKPGLAEAIGKVISPLVDGEDKDAKGQLADIKKDLEARNKTLDDAIEKMQRQIDTRMDGQRKQFVELDKMISQLNNTSNSLVSLLK
ncbi:flagellar hook-associated protein 2 [Biostraticola tofi]|uniref:Flagellar hook-associated protein 2 n=2 Tax=Biostraticola tofi TaxID=466109 RepID=A0A4R3YT13_9GAMM|nr:flagellar hook-associated protein 2 [Biostraticola tofi]